MFRPAVRSYLRRLARPRSQGKGRRNLTAQGPANDKWMLFSTYRRGFSEATDSPSRIRQARKMKQPSGGALWRTVHMSWPPHGRVRGTMCTSKAIDVCGPAAVRFYLPRPRARRSNSSQLPGSMCGASYKISAENPTLPQDGGRGRPYRAHRQAGASEGYTFSVFNKDPEAAISRTNYICLEEYKVNREGEVASGVKSDGALEFQGHRPPELQKKERPPGPSATCFHRQQVLSPAPGKIERTCPLPTVLSGDGLSLRSRTPDPGGVPTTAQVVEYPLHRGMRRVIVDVNRAEGSDAEAPGSLKLNRTPLRPPVEKQIPRAGPRLFDWSGTKPWPQRYSQGWFGGTRDRPALRKWTRLL